MIGFETASKFVLWVTLCFGLCVTVHLFVGIAFAAILWFTLFSPEERREIGRFMRGEENDRQA